MTRKPMFWLVLSAGVMLLLPWLTVTFVQSDAGMAVMLLLFFCIDPAYCVMAGYYSGKEIRCLWWLPLIDSCLFVIGTWLLFEPGEPVFLSYAGIYFVIGMGTMLLSWFLSVRREKHG